MTERGQERRVTPAYRLDFLDTNTAEDVSGQAVARPKYVHIAAVPYMDSVSGLNRLLVISSNDERLVRDMSQSARYHDKSSMTEDILRGRLQSQSERLPDAAIWYDEARSFVKCEEPSCKHHVGGGCTNEKVMIQDDCPEFNYCMTYEEADGFWQGK